MIKGYEQLDKYIETLYPLTIICDRYNGVYSKAKYTAWHLPFSDIPIAIDVEDCICGEFWLSCANKYLVGRGNTTQEAYDDLINKIKAIAQWAEYNDGICLFDLCWNSKESQELIKKFNSKNEN